MQNFVSALNIHIALDDGSGSRIQKALIGASALLSSGLERSL
jgi:hypothetical protein